MSFDPSNDDKQHPFTSDEQPPANESDLPPANESDLPPFTSEEQHPANESEQHPSKGDEPHQPAPLPPDPLSEAALSLPLRRYLEALLALVECPPQGPTLLWLRHGAPRPLIKRRLLDHFAQLQQRVQEETRHLRWYRLPRYLWKKKALHYLYLAQEVSLALLLQDPPGLFQPRRWASALSWPPDALSQRPSPQTSWDQLSCSLESTQARVALALASLPPDARVLFVGDDDLGSIALRLVADIDVHVVEIDERFLDYLDQQQIQITLHRTNVFRDLPGPLEQGFDAVFVDPHWELLGAQVFVQFAARCLRPVSTSRLYLSLYPPWTYRPFPPMRPAYHSLMRFIHRLGLACQQLLPHFNCYPRSQLPPHDEYLKALDWLAPQSNGHPLLPLLRHLPCWLSHLHVLAPLANNPPAPSPPAQTLFHWRGTDP